MPPLTLTPTLLLLRQSLALRFLPQSPPSHSMVQVQDLPNLKDAHEPAGTGYTHPSVAALLCTHGNQMGR